MKAMRELGCLTVLLLVGGCASGSTQTVQSAGAVTAAPEPAVETAEATTIWDGVYTSAQADRGQAPGRRPSSQGARRRPCRSRSERL